MVAFLTTVAQDGKVRIRPVAPVRVLVVMSIAISIASGGCGVTGTTPPTVPLATSIERGATTSSTTATAPTTVAPLAQPTTSPTATTFTTTTRPTTTTHPTTTTTVAHDGRLLALDVLAFITVANEHRGGYVRDLFHYPADLDGDGCNTRAEVLQRDSLTFAQVDPYGCHVVAGDWRSLYDGLTVSDPAELEIDHVVALKEAWDSGAWAWTDAARTAYANDIVDHRTLRAVTITTNRSKGDRDPSNWLPPDAGDTCAYIGDWVAIKVRWSFTMDQSEYGRIRKLLNGPCRGWRIDPLTPPPVTPG
jgi:hypothetical protein